MPARPSDTVAVLNRGFSSGDSWAEGGSDLSAALDAVIGIFTGNLHGRFAVSSAPQEAVPEGARGTAAAWNRLAYLSE